MQAEAGIAELVYLVRVFAIVTNLIFDHSGRVDETGFGLYQFVSTTTNNKGPYRVRDIFWLSPIARVSRAI
jgi:hypothetical protein